MSASQAPRLGVLATLTVAGLSCAAFLIGFLALGDSGSRSTLWQRLCRAAGVTTIADTSPLLRAGSAFTSVIVPRELLKAGSAIQIGHGATLALRCTVCHGAAGVSGANAPNLAGQYAEVIYKQLVDFQRGARNDAVMGAMVASLSDEDMRDLAFYYAYLPRSYADRALASAPALVRVGDPMRSIAPCGSCHGKVDGKAGAPALDGEPGSYLKAQLAAFADGSRRNDANAAMRTQARLLTAAEVDMLADHFSGDGR